MPRRHDTGKRVKILSGYSLKKNITKRVASKNDTPFSIIRIKKRFLPM
jgi:hypothetical protein